MRFYSSIQDFPSGFKSIISIGTFDGVHLGHREILEKLNTIAKKVGGQSVLLSFSPHPRYVLYPEDQDMKLINTIQEKKDLLEDAGLDNLVLHNFTKKFSRTKSINFVRDILVDQMRVHTLVIGYNHHFGRNREGSFNDLLSLADLYDFRIERIRPKIFKGVAVSSTKIRNLLNKGKAEQATKYLGYNFFIRGKIVHGRSIGKRIGFPTANLDIKDKCKLIPLDGVYAVHVKVQDSKLNGMINIGFNPTLDSAYKTIEVHIFEFNKDIYGEEIEIYFIKRLRNEREFQSLDLLKEQLITDKKRAQQIFRESSQTF